jgi:hypothetical protein
MKLSVGTRLFLYEVGLIWWMTMIEAWSFASSVVDKNGADLSIDARAHLQPELFVRVLFSTLGLIYAVINLILVAAGVRIVELLIEQRAAKDAE